MPNFEKINASHLVQAVRRIESLAEGNTIRALDVFFYYDDPEGGLGHAESYSYGDAVYLKPGGILETFLNKFGTLARAEKSIRTFDIIPSRTGSSECGDRGFVKRIVPPESLRQATLEQLVRHLAGWDFGRSFALYTVHQLVRTFHIHLSVFMVFRHRVPQQRQPVIGEEVLWWMLEDVSNLITELFSTDAARLREEKSLVNRLVKVVRHLVKNIPVKANLMLLGDAVESGDMDEAGKLLQIVDRQNVLRDVVTDLIYSCDGRPEGMLLAKQKLTTYTSIISMLVDAYGMRDRVTVGGLTKKVEAHAANRIPLDRLTDIFPMILNIWNNAIRAGNDVAVRYQVEQRDLLIAFENEGTMPKEVREFFNGLSNVNPTAGEGVAQIKDLKARYEGLTIKAKSNRNRTKVTLAIRHEA